MGLYAAIDLHSSNNVLAVIDENDQVKRRCRLRNRLEDVLEELEPFRNELRAIAVESTYNWYWLVDGLRAHAYDTRLVHAAAVPQYSGLKHGDDDSDAFHLAHLLRLGILPEGYIYPVEQRGLRDLMRRRMLLVQQSTRMRQSVQSSYARLCGSRLDGKSIANLDDEQIQQSIDDPGQRLAVQSMWRVRQVLQQEIEGLERFALKQLKGSVQLRRLRTISGIGEVLSLVIVLENGAMERFADVGDYVSYCRLVDSKRLSNGKLKGHGNRKSGNAYLCWAYIEAANYAVRYDPLIRRWYDRKFQKRNKRVIAIKAVAHKLARAAFHMLRTGTDFDSARAFG
jgi:transposase